jgi:hypothetical protein
MVYIPPCLESGVVKYTAAEMPARGAIEGASARLRGEASVVSMACSVDAAQGLPDVLIHPEKCW